MHTSSDNTTLTDDVLWPLVYAASHGVVISIFTVNDHLLSLPDDSCHLWQADYRRSTVKVGIARLFGLGLSRAQVQVVKPTTSSISTSTIIPLELAISHFNEGRDGQLCIIHEGKDLICIIQSDLRIILQVLIGSNNASRRMKTDISIDIEIRGNMFDDVIFKVTHRISVDLSPHAIESSEKDLKAYTTTPGPRDYLVLPILLSSSLPLSFHSHEVEL